MSHELEIMRHSKRYRHASVSDRLWKQQLSEQLDTVLANNIEYWYSTDLSKYWSGNPNRA